jgi:excisionase family DNA binding protein
MTARETASPLTVDEVAELMRVSSKTVMGAIAASHLEASRLTQGRGGWRVRPDAIDAWLEVRSNRTRRITQLGDVARASPEIAAPRRAERSTRARGRGTLIA